MFCVLLAKISGERLQDHWSSGFSREPVANRLQSRCKHAFRQVG